MPRKNVRTLDGKPLIAHSIEHALSSGVIDDVFVSTDDAEIAKVSESFGAKVIWRPAELASDTASSESALVHAMSELGKIGIDPEHVFFLQCTSPVRKPGDLRLAFELMRAENADSLLTATRNHGFLWAYDQEGRIVSVNYDFRNRPRRQDMSPQFRENGSFYIFKPFVLREFNNRLGGKVALYEMTEECSYEIDSDVDFQVIETLMRAM